MRSIKDIIEKKPHLRETLLLYEKVMLFESSVMEKGIIVKPGDICYRREDLDGIFEAFSDIFGIPMENLIPFFDTIIEGRIDFTRLSLNEIPSFLLPYHEEESGMLLFIISRPFFKMLGNMHGEDTVMWEDGRCIVCRSTPTMSSIGSDGRRMLHCSFCGRKGYFRRIECPDCRDFDASNHRIITVENEEGFRIDTCETCGTYMKTINSEMENLYTIDIADLVSLPLDIIAQGRGYRRKSPNPLGMMIMA